MKQLILTAPIGYQDTVEATLDSHGVQQIWWESREASDTTFTVRLISDTEDEQRLMDDLQKTIGGAEDATIYAMNIDTAYPKDASQRKAPLLTRDELLVIAESGARLDKLFFLLVCLSTVVAGIGLLEDNLAVVIGAMVIAPLLGPNLSSALGIALGEFRLARQAMLSLFSGLSVALVIAWMLGQVWPIDEPGPEIISRTLPGLDSPLLALASGVAAVLSLTTGIHGVLVGVMVAVALLPPLASCGILVGLGMYEAGMWALVLFGINAAAINVAAHGTLFLLAIKPRTPAMASVAGRRTIVSGFVWLMLMVGLSWIAIQYR